MVWYQIWCVSKLILHRLTLHWQHTKPTKINRSTRRYFYNFILLIISYHAASSETVTATLTSAARKADQS